MNNKKKIAIFGATGAIGAYTTIDLHQKGYDVIAIGHRPSDNGFFAQYGIPYHSIDISQKKSFENLPYNNIDAVINLAGAMPSNMPIYTPQLYIDSIMTGTLNILDYCIQTNATRITYAQSISDLIYLYGSKTPIPADAPMRFPLNNDHSIYAICKNASVNLIEHYYAKYNLKRFILRFPNIYLYHPNNFYYLEGRKKWHSYRYIINKAQKGEAIELWGDPNIVRDIVYVKDCTQIIYKTIEAKVDGGIYNVGTGIGTTMREQIEGIITIFSPLNSPSSIIERPDMPNSPEYIMDISKTIQELGYTPHYMYLDYLKDMKNLMENKPFRQLWGC